jgi:glycosyltransferase involved in cell wall biosynthesis
MKRENPFGSVSVADAMRIAVIIPCYNQARFLADAIDSVLAQTYRRYEIIVVDDGSTDHTATVASAYPQVTYLYQDNQGLSAARNTGWRACQSDGVVFLDADDRLLPTALEAGVRCLQDHPECAFVSGHFRYIQADGTFLHEYPQIYVERDHYQALLRGNYIGMHATVMYRRVALEWAGGFDTSLRACEDYDLYLRLARHYPVYCHRAVVAEYRQHHANMSGDAVLMLRTAINVLRSQYAFVVAERPLRQAFRAGLKGWTGYYGKRLLSQFVRSCRQGDVKRAARVFMTLLQYTPHYLLNLR